jgi:hypothetical protein
MTNERAPSVGDEDFDWVHAHMDGELRAYQGQWIAVVNKRVVAAGSSVLQILDEVGAQGLSNPFVTKVPTDRERRAIFVG